MSRKTYRSHDFHELVNMMPAASAAFMRKEASRRSVLGGIAGLAGLGLARPAFGQEASPEPTSNVWTPPADAAPLEEQVFRVASQLGNAVAVEFYESVYQRPAVNGVTSPSLVFLTKEFEIEPGAATEWSSNEDGTEWTFKLREGITWSDGNPLTAADFVKTFQYSADPEHAWDFSWFWSGDLLNYTEAVAGEVPVEEIGVRQGANEYEVVFQTVNPAPYLPAKLLYSLPLSKAALEAHGAFYNSNPETAVSCGPFILGEWVPDQSLTWVRNEAYDAPWPVPFQKIIVKFAEAAQFFTLYEAGEIDQMESPAPAELTIMQSDPEKEGEIYQGVGDFGCFYFFFDVTKPPFDNLQVRQAFSHVLDREAMKAQIWGPQANPAPSFLAPGFPASNTEELAGIQNFDPELGRQLLAEAGYPEGEGFPELTLTVRGGPTPLEEATTQSYAAMIEEHLGIPVEVTTLDRQAFYDDMRAVHFGWVSYGMDYFDPSNMLGVWKTGGRHPWSNPEFDAGLDEATVFLGDPAERLEMFKAVERILVEDVPAVFTYFFTPIQLIKPYVIGPALEPDSNGIAAIHWPGLEFNGSAMREIYIGADAPTGRQ